jgi:hypothetical protein
MHVGPGPEGMDLTTECHPAAEVLRTMDAEAVLRRILG